ncbi:MAG: hypothetical protein J0H65_14745, partial [Rhizobiales bacterium]|nr:hypothetical protein [Hyphomicrobiales bacterium]
GGGGIAADRAAGGLDKQLRQVHGGLPKIRVRTVDRPESRTSETRFPPVLGERKRPLIRYG